MLLKFLSQTLSAGSEFFCSSYRIGILVLIFLSLFYSPFLASLFAHLLTAFAMKPLLLILNYSLYVSHTRSCIVSSLEPNTYLEAEPLKFLSHKTNCSQHKYFLTATLLHLRLKTLLSLHKWSYFWTNLISINFNTHFLISRGGGGKAFISFPIHSVIGSHFPNLFSAPNPSPNP